jgi:hypothetical protein
MNPAVKRVALLVRDLMGYNEQLIRVGRQNFQRADFETAYVVVDELVAATRVGNMETFDGNTEVLSIGAMWRGTVTLDFYGDDAYTRAIEFSLRAKSQAAYELKRTLGINAYHASGPTDLKALTGQQYGERVQLEMVVEVSSDVTIDTLRIDTAQIRLLTETEEVLFNG